MTSTTVTDDQKEIQPNLEDTRLVEPRTEGQDLHLTVKFITDDTFAVYDGFDLALLDDKNGWPASNIPTFSVPRKQPYSTFKSRTAKHFGYPEDRIRLWVLVQRQNKTVRVDGLIPERTLTLDSIHRNMCSARNDLPLYLELLSEPKSGRPPDLMMVFLKHFYLDKQTLRGVGKVHILIKRKKIGDLAPVINERMRWPPNTPLKFYEEIKPGMVGAMNPQLTFYQSKIRDGDIICFEVDISQDERRRLESRGLRSNAISHYDFLHNRVMVTFQDKLSEDTPEFTLVLSKKDICATMSKMASEHLRQDPAISTLQMMTRIGSGQSQYISEHQSVAEIVSPTGTVISYFFPPIRPRNPH
ncbi:ICP0-binding domain of ubiquitin-specific protease 7-domain-containing protein [Mycena sanguinolenta]|nr:ICP0-binding domain of ubiquitin-specific protease 7-domain-containing protein [Mycena sanguinolenta]